MTLKTSPDIGRRRLVRRDGGWRPKAPTNRSVVRGVVNEAAGHTVAGARVKLINADRHMNLHGG